MLRRGVWRNAVVAQHSVLPRVDGPDARQMSSPKPALLAAPLASRVDSAYKHPADSAPIPMKCAISTLCVGRRPVYAISDFSILSESM